jgi:TM2 domain-containing membrane protein YozV
MQQTPAHYSDKSRTIALAIGVPLGVFGAHRFYVGKVGTGLLQLCTLGGFGLWWLYDMILIASGGFTDAAGLRVMLWDPDHDALLPSDLAGDVALLQSEVAELRERLDFTERLLAEQAQARRIG